MSRIIKIRAIDLENLGVDLRFVHGDYSDEEREAIKHQARLIAAAPELLEALQMLYSETLDYIRLNNLGGEDNQCMRLSRAAIAKTTGSAS